MAEWPTLTVDDLSAFSGRPTAVYPTPFSDTALVQARILFKIATCLSEFPEIEDDATIARMALLAQADDLILKQPHQVAASSPFNSESIGSYHYSFMKRATVASKGDKVGVTWFDLAVEKLGVCEIVNQVPMTGGIMVFENDLLRPKTGQYMSRILGPADIRASRNFGFDPAPGFGGVPSITVEYEDEWTEDPVNPGFYTRGDM